MKRFCIFVVFIAISIYLSNTYAAGNLTGLSLTANTIHIVKSTSYDINVIGKKTGLSYNWTTSDRNVVKVNDKNGVINAVKEGEALITCNITGANGVKKKLTCKVVVGLDEDNPQLNRTNLNLKVGERFDINVAKKIVNSKYNYKSLNETVFKINSTNGVVVGVGKGEAQVICTITAPDKHIIVLNGKIVVTGQVSNIIWEDDFNTSAVESTNWGYEYGHVRNQELQEYTDSTDNAFLRDGNLVIKAIKDTSGKWTSSSIMTNNKFEVGNARIEARIKLPKVNGAFPAFWMMGADYERDYKKQKNVGDSWLDAREIDIIESFGKGLNVLGGVFYKASPDAVMLSHTSEASQDIDITQFHTYAIEKNDTTLNFYCDDRLYHSHKITDDGLSKPFFIMLNLAVGASGGIPDQATTDMEMVVDYVRATTLDNLPAKEPEAISFDTDTLNGKAGEVKKVNFRLLPLETQNRTVIWRSSDTSIATVYGGNIEMKKAGTCIITATTYNGLIATCKVICK